MMPLLLRQAEESDVLAMAKIRARVWQTEGFWTDRIGRYLRAEHSPQQALASRTAFVAIEENVVVGFVAGHRTRRHQCDGELQWINVVEEKRGQSIAGKLLEKMAGWFVEQGAVRICVNVDPNNTTARRFYEKCGAKFLNDQPMNDQWMIWEDVRRMRCEPTKNR
jgi:ribosomal protein S18 acetylase RimI-like enzyme